MTYATVDSLITETASLLLAKRCTHAAIQRAEDVGGAPEIWAEFAKTGFPWVSLPEQAGGSGGTLLDALEILRLVGYHAAPIPVAETAMLGGWLLASAGLELPGGIVTVAPGGGLRIDDDDTVSGLATMVPWGRSAERLAVVSEGKVASVPMTAASSITEQSSLAGEPRDSVVLEAVPADVATAPDGVDDEALRFRGALSRVAMMAGAIQKISQLTVSYCNQRQQFGRPIARFQAVQQHLVWAAQDAALARMAAEAAGQTAHRGEARFEIAAAKLNTNQAATRATKACHQAHGAMGMTQEYPLHHYSRRLWSWRNEYGGVAECARWIGRCALTQGADALYPLITGGSNTAAVAKTPGSDTGGRG